MLLFPDTARNFLARYFGDNLELMTQVYEQGDWGSHVLRAVLSVAVEPTDELQIDLVPRIVRELKAQPQILAEFAGSSMPDAAITRSRMALFDARRHNEVNTPTIEQFVEHWR